MGLRIQIALKHHRCSHFVDSLAPPPPPHSALQQSGLRLHRRKPLVKEHNLTTCRFAYLIPEGSRLLRRAAFFPDQGHGETDDDRLHLVLRTQITEPADSIFSLLIDNLERLRDDTERVG